jgi:hypothetical protein
LDWDFGQELRAGSQKPGFCDNISLSPADSLKNPVSFVETRNSYMILTQKLGCKAMKLKWLIPAIISSCLIVVIPAKAAETRCGWLRNPTPANWYLHDKDGQWTISVQGGYQAGGMNNMPPLNDDESFKFGVYRSFCACLNVVTDRNRMRMTTIQGGEQLPLSTCREDPNLPR